MNDKSDFSAFRIELLNCKWLLSERKSYAPTLLDNFPIFATSSISNNQGKVMRFLQYEGENSRNFHMNSGKISVRFSVGLPYLARQTASYYPTMNRITKNSKICWSVILHFICFIAHVWIRCFLSTSEGIMLEIRQNCFLYILASFLANVRWKEHYCDITSTFGIALWEQFDLRPLIATPYFLLSFFIVCTIYNNGLSPSKQIIGI